MKNRIAEYLPTAWFRKQREAAAATLSQNGALKAVVEPVEDFVSKNPAAALAIAFAAGVAIAWWLKRR